MWWWKFNVVRMLLIVMSTNHSSDTNCNTGCKFSCPNSCWNELVHAKLVCADASRWNGEV
eukprot:11680275-Prorocentrum_lima.AAC.1